MQRDEPAGETVAFQMRLRKDEAKRFRAYVKAEAARAEKDGYRASASSVLRRLALSAMNAGDARPNEERKA